MTLSNKPNIDDLRKVVASELSKSYNRWYGEIADPEHAEDELLGTAEQILKTLYTRLLTVIGADEEVPDDNDPVDSAMVISENRLRAAQRKALAELMGQKE